MGGIISHPDKSHDLLLAQPRPGDSFKRRPTEPDRISGSSLNPSFATAISHAKADPKAKPVTIDRRYVLTDVRCSGGMSEVYAAVDRADKKKVVIKIATANDSMDEGISNLFIRREWAALTRLHHPNIVNRIRHGTHASREYMALEEAPGRELHFLLKAGGRLQWETAKKILIQLCDALSAVHKAGMAHGDVKPSNVIIGRSGSELHATLIDFGIVRFLDPDGKDLLTQVSWGSLGTIGYIPPEQYTSMRYDERSDIFCLGICMYEMMSGTNPFKRHDLGIQELARFVEKHEPKPPGGVAAYPGSSVVDPIVMHALSKRPGDRFLNAEEMKTAILSCP
jgi:serine/threonine protein kinase